MKMVQQELLTGERALYHARDLEINDSTFADGESPLKESKNIILNNSIFKWKYPMWYSSNIKVNNSVLLETARSGIWYTNDITFYAHRRQVSPIFVSKVLARTLS